MRLSFKEGCVAFTSKTAFINNIPESKGGLLL